MVSKKEQKSNARRARKLKALAMKDEVVEAEAAVTNLKEKKFASRAGKWLEVDGETSRQLLVEKSAEMKQLQEAF